jgi:arylsulfatase A-like enzyme
MPKNVIALMFDTLSYRFIRSYGNDWIQTPNMDRLAHEGMLFEQNYTEGLPTVPCRRAMWTGRYTLPVSGWVPLSAEDTTIADLCWGNPIDKALIFDNPQIHLPKFGYVRGFDKVCFTRGHEGDDYFYQDDSLFHRDAHDFFEQTTLDKYTERVGEGATNHMLKEVENYLKQMQYWRKPEDRYVFRTMRHAIDYLENTDRQKQFFLWIDSFDPHEPWGAPSVFLDQPCMYDPEYKGKHEFHPMPEVSKGLYTEEQMHHTRMLYAELVTLCDRALGELLQAIKRMGLEENTLIMMLSDHGTPQGEGKWGHGIMRKSRPWPYDELAHAPMIIRMPGGKPGQRNKSFVQSCDVAPTILDWLGIPIPESMQGKSLLPIMEGKIDKVRDFAIAGYYGYSWAIYTKEWSYVHWLTDEKAASEVRRVFYVNDAPHLTPNARKYYMGSMNEDREVVKEDESAIALNAKAKDMNLTLDGKDQWTCTPGSRAELPDRDELYSVSSDPYQLKNVISEYPDVAADLLYKLKSFMSELATS